MHCLQKKIVLLQRCKLWLEILQRNCNPKLNPSSIRTLNTIPLQNLCGKAREQLLWRPKMTTFSCLKVAKDVRQEHFLSTNVKQLECRISDITTKRSISAKSEMITEMHGGHIPVLLKEVVEILDPQNSKLYVDMTFGAGGHTKQILNVAPEARVVCLDQDQIAHQKSVDLSHLYSPGQIIPIDGRFSELPEKLLAENIMPGTVDGFLFDVGASSLQFDSAERGFSLSKDGYLDMRMDQRRRITAMDVVNNLDERQLADIIKKYGEEKNYRKIATAIVESRYAFGKITRTKQLADVIESVFDETYQKDKLNRKAHVATRTFQALRIFVNNELNELNNGLTIAHHYLKPGGKCLVISFHSLEDRLVKRQFHGINIDDPKNMSLRDRMRFRNSNVSHETEAVDSLLKTKNWTPMYKKAIEPSATECEDNPRCRSSKLRAATKSV